MNLVASFLLFASHGMGEGLAGPAVVPGGLLWGMMFLASLCLSGLSTFPVLPLGSLAQLVTAWAPLCVSH